MIDPHAIVDCNAELAADVEVGPFAVIGPGVRIGAGCRIEQSASIHGPTEMGENNHIYPFCSIGSDPQDKKYRQGDVTRLRIGNGNTIREYCSINRGTLASEETVLGNHNWIMANVHIAHDCIVGDHCVLANQVALSGHVQVGDYVILSGFSGITQFCRIGVHAFVMGHSIVDRHIPPYVRVAGDRARFIDINTRGLARRNYSAAQISILKKTIREFYMRSNRKEEGLERMRATAPGDPDVQAFIDFIRTVDDSPVSLVSGRAFKMREKEAHLET